MNKIYPAIFMKEDIGYSVIFPDLPGCQTQGDSMEEAIEMAQEALGIYLDYRQDKNMEIPEPSDPTIIETNQNEFVSLITAKK